MYVCGIANCERRKTTHTEESEASRVRDSRHELGAGDTSSERRGKNRVIDREIAVKTSLQHVDFSEKSCAPASRFFEFLSSIGKQRRRRRAYVSLRRLHCFVSRDFRPLWQATVNTPASEDADVLKQAVPRSGIA